MKHLKIMSAVLIVLFAMAMKPSSAAAQFYHEERLDHFLDGHPEVKGELERNPNLIYNRGWRDHHPELRQFMQNHPNVWGKMEGSNRWGAYGPNNEWHEADWWHDHDRGWFYKNHPEWAENHPEWRDEGDFDEHREWHDRDWWHDHHPDWVDAHHPNWYKHPYEHPIAAEEHKQHEEHLEEQQVQHHDHGHGHDKH
jgi:hypothetical protein